MDSKHWQDIYQRVHDQLKDRDDYNGSPAHVREVYELFFRYLKMQVSSMLFPAFRLPGLCYFRPSPYKLNQVIREMQFDGKWAYVSNIEFRRYYEYFRIAYYKSKLYEYSRKMKKLIKSDRIAKKYRRLIKPATIDTGVSQKRILPYKKRRMYPIEHKFGPGQSTYSGSILQERGFIFDSNEIFPKVRRVSGDYSTSIFVERWTKFPDRSF